MKKNYFLFLMLIALVSCGGKKQNPEMNAGNLSFSAPKVTENRDPDKIDIDISAMGADMVYAMIFQFLVEPENYLGKRVKMQGGYYPSPDDEGNVYNYVVIRDALACCAQGIEFKTSEDMSGTINSLTEESEIAVTGIFDEGKSDEGYSYCFLKDCILEVLKK